MAYTKNSLKWILDQNVKVKIIKLLEKNLGENLFFFLTNLFIYLFLAVLDLHCCVWAFSSCGKRAFSSCGEQGLFFVAVHGLLIAVASLVAEHGL